jgi:hypothetical protein
MVLLAEAPPLPPPSVETLQRVASLIEAECRADQRARRVLGWATTGAVLLAWGIQLAVGSGLARDTNSVSISLAVLAAALAGGAFSRPSQRLVVSALVMVAGSFAFAVGALPGFEPKAGVLCLFYELGAGVLTWLVAWRVARSSGLILDRWQGASVAAAGALASGAAQHLTCPVSHAGPHLLVFHFGGVLLAAMLGASGTLLTVG